MFTAEVSHMDLIAQEESLTDYLRYSDDWNKKINQAKQFVAREIKANGKELKKICVPLYLTKDGTHLGEAVSDTVERLRLIVECECTEAVHIQLTGCDTSDGTFSVVPLIDSEGVEHQSLSFSENARKTAVITQAYNFYKLSVTGTTTSLNSFLIESIFDMPVTFKALEFIFKDLQAEQNSNFEGKSEYYRDLYNDCMSNAVYSYDDNADGVADETEINNTKTITLMR